MTEQEKPKNHRIKIIPLRNRPGLCGPAAAWFSGKWGIPEAEYRRSMKGMLQKSAAVPQWYVTLGGQGEILADIGVIENDFSQPEGSFPQFMRFVCRGSLPLPGGAGMLLDFIRKDLGKLGIPVLYLATGHTGFYEKYGWRFVTMAMGDDQQPLRLYQSSAFSPSPPSALR